MAIDNLNYMVSGLPAGQQTDKYSTNPGCIKSKNLDIFSSSKSVKATAWSEGEEISQSNILLKDEYGILVYKSDGKVYDTRDNTVVYDVAGNFKSQNVDYNGDGTYVLSSFGTPKLLTSVIVNGVIKSFCVITDRAKFDYSKEYYSPKFKTHGGEYMTKWDEGYYGIGDHQFTNIYFDNLGIEGNTDIVLSIKLEKTSGNINARLYGVGINKPKLKYSRKYNIMDYSHQDDYSFSGSSITDDGQYHDISLNGWYAGGDSRIRLEFYCPTSASSTYSGTIEFFIKGVHTGYTLLPINSNPLSDLGNYKFEPSGNVQTLYGWSYEWMQDWYRDLQESDRWKFGMVGVWDTDPSMNIVAGVVRNTNPYLIGNKDSNGYIIPAPIGGDTENPYNAEGVKFLNAVPIDYYMYLVGEERGVSGLYVYSGQQLVKLLSGTEIKSENDLVDNTEQFKFDGTMCNYRGRIVLGTEDGRVFMYGKTTNGNGGAFIHKVDGDITDIKVENDKLVVYYTKNSVKYKTTFQDAIHSKNYNTEWESEYPITIGNHILEKEEADLYASYILCKNNSLEFRASANHYQYWSFKGDADITIGDGREVKVGCWSGDYKLTFVEKNGLRYTFKLEGDLPVQTVGNKEIKKVDGTHLINYTEYNNFRRIGKVESDKFKEDKIRFHNINNLLDLPNSHSIQIMVRGKGTANHSPELFSVDLVANQRERG